VVTPEDTVYHLGDLSFALRSVELYSDRLNGTKILIPGNHDPAYPLHKLFRKAIKQGRVDSLKEFYESYGWRVASEMYETLDIPGVATVNLNHMPYDTADPRFLDYLTPDDGRWLLCGHIHQHWKVRGRMINVGVDVWDFTPVHIDEIAKIILRSADATESDNCGPGRNTGPITES
jgi:calcineurin-like phosphoesterase family protein